MQKIKNTTEITRPITDYKRQITIDFCFEKYKFLNSKVLELSSMLDNSSLTDEETTKLKIELEELLEEIDKVYDDIKRYC